MASLVGTAVAGVFNAFAFAGAGYLFQHLNKKGYEDEMERHNKALEDLAKAKELFYENEVKQHDKIMKLRQEIAEANSDIEQTNKALDTLRQVRKITYNGNNFTSEPKLDDFYKPSAEMEEYQMLVGCLIGAGVGYVTYKVI